MPKGKKHSAEQIIAVLRRAEGGQSVSELCREINISEASFYRWQRQYGGMEKSELIELKSLREENARLQRWLRQAHIGSRFIEPGRPWQNAS
jgi:putative transposase